MGVSKEPIFLCISSSNSVSGVGGSVGGCGVGFVGGAGVGVGGVWGVGFGSGLGICFCLSIPLLHFYPCEHLSE